MIPVARSSVEWSTCQGCDGWFGHVATAYSCNLAQDGYSAKTKTETSKWLANAATVGLSHIFFTCMCVDQRRKLRVVLLSMSSSIAVWSTAKSSAVEAENDFTLTQER